MFQVGQEWIEFQGRQWLDGFFKMKKQSPVPATPDINFIHLYSRDKAGVAELFYKNDAGVERDLSLSEKVDGAGSGIANRLAFWTNTTTISSHSALTAGAVAFGAASGLPTENATKLFWDTVNLTLLIGNNSQPPVGIANRGLAVLRDGIIAEVDLYGFGLSGPGAVFRGLIGRGTIASPSAALANDSVLLLLTAFDGAGSADSPALIALACAENQSLTNKGSYITFETTPLGSTIANRAARFRIGPSGQWGIAGANFGTAGQYKRSGGPSAAPSWLTIPLSEISPRDHVTLTAIGANDHHTENHKARHVVGGADPFVGGDLLDATARVTVRKNTGVDVGARRRLNLIEGANITLTVADDIAGEEVDVTVAAGAGGSANIKQVELDFGTAHNIKEGAFTIVDADVLAGSQIIMLQALDAPTGKVEDENEMDSFNCKCRPDPVGGQFKAYIESQYGSVTDKFKFNYLVG